MDLCVLPRLAEVPQQTYADAGRTGLRVVRSDVGLVTVGVGGPGDVQVDPWHVADEFRRVLKPGGRCTLMVGDVRKGGSYVPLGLLFLELFMKKGFRLDDLIVKEQEHTSHDEFYLNKPFLRISHEYLFVLSNSGSAITQPD